MQKLMIDDAAPSLPVVVVTDAAQLPACLLEPPAPPAPPVVVGFDCEGIDLARHGRLCVMQVALPSAIYLVDVAVGGAALVGACKGWLESRRVVKVVHDCKRDGEALFFQFGVRLQGIFDTQLAYTMIEQGSSSSNTSSSTPSSLLDQISFVQLLAMPKYCGVTYDEKEEVRELMRQNASFWQHRPWTPTMLRAAADDVRFLLQIHSSMVRLLAELPADTTSSIITSSISSMSAVLVRLQQLAVRSELHARCFCEGAHVWGKPEPWDADLAGIFEGWGDGAAAAAAPDSSSSSSSVVVDEILSVVDVPPGMMGLVIGKKGATIRSVKDTCKALIITGGQKGPPDKVFIIGGVKEAHKAEAIIRGKVAR